jgi:hypothetical protein
MVIFSTVTEKSQMACHEWEENSKGTILTPEVLGGLQFYIN